MNCANVDYRPKRFSAAIIRIREPKTTALVFQSGKMICLGAKTEEVSRDAVKRYTRMLRKTLNRNITFHNFTVQNVVASHDVGFSLKVEQFYQEASSAGMVAKYDPENFSSMVLKMKVPKVTLLIFHTGKIIITGAKSRDQVYAVYDKVKYELKRHMARTI